MTEPSADDFERSPAKVTELRAVSTRKPNPEGLKGSGGGGTFDDMEARVASLEAHMLNVRENIGLIRTDARQATTDINSIRISAAMLTERVSHLPSKGWGVTAIILLASFLTAMTLLGPRLLKLAGQ
jgi:hypothetical protein